MTSAKETVAQGCVIENISPVIVINVKRYKSDGSTEKSRVEVFQTHIISLSNHVAIIHAYFRSMEGG